LPSIGSPYAKGGGAPPTLDEIKRMSADEINARWDEILPVLEGGHDR
jgi:hypothetical protein